MEYCVYSSFAYVSSYEHGSGKSPTKNRKQIDINDHIIKIINSDKKIYSEFCVTDHFSHFEPKNGEYLVEIFDHRLRNRHMIHFEKEADRRKFLEVAKPNAMIYLIENWEQACYFCSWFKFGCSFIFLVVFGSMIEIRRSSLLVVKEKEKEKEKEKNKEKNKENKTQYVVDSFQTALCMISNDLKNEVKFAICLDTIINNQLYTFGAEDQEHIIEFIKATNESSMDTFYVPYSFPCRYNDVETDLNIHISEGIKCAENKIFPFQHVRGIKTDGNKLEIIYKEDDHVACDRKTMICNFPTPTEPAIIKALIINGGNALHQAWIMLLNILREKTWFKENLSRVDAEKFLLKKGPNNFVLRTSKRFQFHFAITVYSAKHGCCTWKLCNFWTQYRIARCIFDSIDEILQFYMINPLVSDSGAEYFILMQGD